MARPLGIALGKGILADTYKLYSFTARNTIDTRASKFGQFHSSINVLLYKWKISRDLYFKNFTSIGKYEILILHKNMVHSSHS